MDYEDIIVEQSNGIITLTLNRPAKLNALGANLRDEVGDVVEKFEQEDEAKRMQTVLGVVRVTLLNRDKARGLPDEQAVWDTLAAEALKGVETALARVKGDK